MTGYINSLVLNMRTTSLSEWQALLIQNDNNHSLEMLPGVGLMKLPLHWDAKLPMTCLTMIILNILDLILNCISLQRKWPIMNSKVYLCDLVIPRIKMDLTTLIKSKKSCLKIYDRFPMHQVSKCMTEHPMVSL